jgi:hypothetical protein
VTVKPVLDWRKTAHRSEFAPDASAAFAWLVQATGLIAAAVSDSGDISDIIFTKSIADGAGKWASSAFTNTGNNPGSI